MTKAVSSARILCAIAFLTSTALVAGCGSDHVTKTTTTEQTTSAPAPLPPPGETTTTTTTQQTQH